MPPAYAAAVAALADDKASAVGKGLASWAEPQKLCYMPKDGFITPSFYHMMFKEDSSYM